MPKWQALMLNNNDNNNQLNYDRLFKKFWTDYSRYCRGGYWNNICLHNGLRCCCLLWWHFLWPLWKEVVVIRSAENISWNKMVSQTVC